ncbi:MAG: hypothetical protein J5934_07730 [Succinivibrio sp.]|nr:hypothetical protein [Succinivibrio sp.]
MNTNEKIETAVKTAAEGALEKLGLFEVRSVVSSIMTPEATLREAITRDYQVTEQVKQELTAPDAAYTAKTFGKIFAKQELDDLRHIRDEVYAYLDSVGTKIEGQSAYYVLSKRHEEVSKELKSFEDKFTDKVNEILNNYDNIVAAVESDIDSKVSTPEVARAIKEKIPSAKELQARCKFGIQTSSMLDPSSIQQSQESMAIDIANSLSAIKAAEEGFLSKITEPFSEMLDGIYAAQRSGGKYAGDPTKLGKKRGSMCRVVSKVLAQEFNLKVVFSDGEKGQLISTVFDLLKEVRDKFCTNAGNAKKSDIPVILEKRVLENFYRIAGIFSSLSNIEKFVQSGAPLFDADFDLRNVREMAKQARNPAAVQVEEAKEENAAAQAPAAPAAPQDSSDVLADMASLFTEFPQSVEVEDTGAKPAAPAPAPQAEVETTAAEQSAPVADTKAQTAGLASLEDFFNGSLDLVAQEQEPDQSSSLVDLPF